MGKFDGYLLMTDFDNTLAYGGTVSKENCDAIRYFQSEGGLFTLATGRQYRFISQWHDFFVPNTYLSTLNGAYLCDVTGQHVAFEKAMEPDFFDLAAKIRDACPDLEYIYFHPLGEGVQIKRDEPLPPELRTKPVYKMVCYAHRAQSDEYKARIASLSGERYLTMRSWINGIEVQSVGTGKGDSVRRFKTLLGERARVVVAAGDYENDIDMVREADIGYAVENAVPELKAVADRVTVPAKEHAIAKIIEELGSPSA